MKQIKERISSLIFFCISLTISCTTINPKKEIVQRDLAQDKDIPSFQFKRISKGRFMMGRKGFVGWPQRDVTISKDYEIMTTEVTQEQWFTVMKANPSYFKTPKFCNNHVRINGEYLCPNHPVEQVSWSDVQKFIKKLNAAMGLEGCDRTPQSASGCYRLPTEAEWEWAARGPMNLNWIEKDKILYNKTSGGRTQPVGSGYPVNGLYNIYGNVSEWVQDAYRSFQHRGKLPIRSSDPLVNSGRRRIIRGCNWYCPWYGEGMSAAGFYSEKKATERTLRVSV